MPDNKRAAPPVRRTAADSCRYDREPSRARSPPVTLRRAGLHHCVRRRHSTARRPACPRGVGGHAPHRQGLLRPDGEQPLCDASDPGGRARAVEGVCRVAVDAAKGYAPKLVNPGGVEVWKATGGNATARRRRSSISVSRPDRSSKAWRRRRANSVCRIRSTSTATTSGCRATGPRRWRR